MKAEKLLRACGLGLVGTAMAIGALAQSVVAQEADGRLVPGVNTYPRANDLRVETLNGRVQLTGEIVKSTSRALLPVKPAVSGPPTAADARFQPQEIPMAWVSPPRLPATTDDAAITASIVSELAWSRHAEGLVAEVHTNAGSVRLRGKADRAAALAFAIRIASNTYGVVSVDNQLSLELAKLGPVQRVMQALREGWSSLPLKAALRPPAHPSVAAVPAGGSSDDTRPDAGGNPPLMLAAKLRNPEAPP